MSSTPHQCFTVSTTAYLRNLDPADEQEVYAVHYEDPPRRNEDGTTSYSMIAPTLIVSAYMAEPEKIANRVAALLNTHWDENASLTASAANLRDAGLLTPADYHRTIQRIEARARLCRLKEIVS
jgi:hypothetical protein